jgi:septum formation protein
MNKLVLASSSTYRKLLLERLQLPFECHSPEVDESRQIAETGHQLAQRLSLQKARVVGEAFPDSIIIGSDQVAELLVTEPEGSQQATIIGKPGNHQQAVKQLTAQSGHRVSFHTGLAVIYQGVEKSIVDTTEVDFRPLTEHQIEHYLRTEKPYDCAGSFKAESLGISLFSGITSNDPTSLIGLPLIKLCELLREFDIEV